MRVVNIKTAVEASNSNEPSVNFGTKIYKITARMSEI